MMKEDDEEKQEKQDEEEKAKMDEEHRYRYRYRLGDPATKAATLEYPCALIIISTAAYTVGRDG